MARRKGGKSQRSRKPQKAPHSAVAQSVQQDIQHETAPTDAPPAGTESAERAVEIGSETSAEKAAETALETPTETPEEAAHVSDAVSSTRTPVDTEARAPEPPVSQDPGQDGRTPRVEDRPVRAESEGAGPEPVDIGAYRSSEPERDEPEPDVAPEDDEEQASAPVDASAQAEVDPTAPAEPRPVDPDTAVLASTEPQRPAAHVVQASPAAYGPEAVTPADLAVDREGVPRGHVEGKAAWRRLFRMGRPRTTKANVLGALLAVALGVGIATQVQLTNERGLSELSQSDLIRLLDDISARSNRLDEQVRELESRREALLSGTDSTGEALEQAQRRADTLGILAGTLPAQGQGITVSISDPNRQVTGPVVLDLIQELRDAGAESIDVGGVRVVASSYVGDSGGDLSVDGTSISRPVLVKAIGDSNTLASAMTIPGGIVETIRQKGGNASVNESTSIEITSTHTPKPLTHAEPSQ